MESNKAYNSGTQNTAISYSELKEKVKHDIAEGKKLHGFELDIAMEIALEELG